MLRKVVMMASGRLMWQRLLFHLLLSDQRRPDQKTGRKTRLPICESRSITGRFSTIVKNSVLGLMVAAKLDFFVDTAAQGLWRSSTISIRLLRQALTNHLSSRHKRKARSEGASLLSRLDLAFEKPRQDRISKSPRLSLHHVGPRGRRRGDVSIDAVPLNSMPSGPKAHHGTQPD